MGFSEVLLRLLVEQRSAQRTQARQPLATLRPRLPSIVFCPCLKENQSHTVTLLADSCVSEALWGQPPESSSCSGTL